MPIYAFSSIVHTCREIRVGKLTRNQIAEPYLTNQNELKLIETKTFGNYGSVCLSLSAKISQSWNSVFLL
jgi:hypothetical protein